MRKESPARWAPVATGARFVAGGTAQLKSRDTRSASLALGRGRKRRILRIFRLTVGAEVTPSLGSCHNAAMVPLPFQQGEARPLTRLARIKKPPPATAIGKA